MALKFDGSTGYLELASKLVGTGAMTIVAYTSSDSSGAQAWASQAQSNGDRYAMLWIDANGVSKYASLRNPSNGSNAQKDTAPQPTTTLQLGMAVFNGGTSRTVYYGNNTPATDSTALTDDKASHDRFTIGAFHNNSNSPLLFTNGSIAEVHVYNVALTATDFENIRTAVAKPEDISGWVDGWMLKNTSDLTSIGGSRTLTLTGGVTNSTQSHPIARVSVPVLSSPTGSATSATTLTTGVTTDTATGTLYLLLDGNTTATNTAIAASSRSQVITASGAKTFNVTGLTPGAVLYPHYVQVVSGVYSNVINGSAITLPAAGAPDPATINGIVPGNSQVSVSYTPGAANGATITGHVLKVYKASDNTLVSTSTASTSSPIVGTAINGVSVYGKIESTNSAGTVVSASSGTVTPSATVVTSTITPPNLPLTTAAGATGAGAVWISEPVKIVVISASDPTQATQVFNQTTTTAGKLGAITITGAAGFLAQVMVWRVADRTFLGSFPATSA